LYSGEPACELPDRHSKSWSISPASRPRMKAPGESSLLPIEGGPA
jgi:hypothetical protein